MFGRDYDKEINDLNKRVNELLEALNESMKSQREINNLLKERIEGSERLMLELAKVQASHKKAIQLLLQR